MAYDFTCLDPIEFEQLVCDIFSHKYKTHVESFTAGPDSGIDLRYECPQSGKTTIVQCKRYSEKNFSSLKSSITLERPKLERLKPEHYKLATSIPLTPSQKQELFELLKPWCTSVSDILGKNDLNSLLGEMEQVVRKHFKLWLTSSAVLDQVINAGIFNFTSSQIESTKKELGKLVIHDGLDQCLKILEKNNHTLIAGDPGVGKTTLAKIISCQLTTKGYESIFVNSDINEAWSVLHKANDPAKKLLLIYDDFLGRFELNNSKLSKNEDKQIIELIKKCENSKNIKLILTTREYILEDAKQKNGTLSERSGEIEKFVVKIENYTKAHKGRILFNHLYFSDLPENRLKAITTSKVYREIVAHKNYNPRIIESICKDANSRHLSDDGFLSFIRETLRTPNLVWKQPFNREISQTARLILITLASFDGTANIDDIKDSVKSIEKPKDDFSFEQRFLDSHKQIEGNFTLTNRRLINDFFEHIVEFGNPSIEEFVTHFIRENPELVQHLKDGITFYNQALTLYRIVMSADSSSKKRRESLRTIHKKLVDCQDAFYFKPSRVIVNSKLGWFRNTVSKFGQLLHDLSIRIDYGDKILNDEIDKMTGFEFWHNLIKESRIPPNTMAELSSLTEWIVHSDMLSEAQEVKFEDNLRAALFDSDFIEFAIDDFDDMEHFHEAVTRIDTFLTSEQEAALEEVFQINIKDDLIEDGDIDDLERALSTTTDMGLDIGLVELEIRERIEELEEDYRRDEQSGASFGHYHRSNDKEDFDLDNLFGELLYH